MKRIVEPELLDELPPSDPQAIHSRRDLRRLNRIMRHAELLCATTAASLPQPPRTIADLGAGDGSLLLAIARRMHARWPGVRVVLVDRQKNISADTLAEFRDLGWTAEAVTADVFVWLATASSSTDMMVANLFLHHFADEKLAELLRLVAPRTDFFIASETRRTWPALTAGRLLGLIGCNAVTRHDARISLHAGFVRRELSALWPAASGWKLEERGALIFTHLFTAQRTR
ncbi:MAG: methyltransferase domain-containing protein [Verrucomicrobia bacterium]|nr:methyltransferase domain-containing protein [Verrucomicrobiota bacterium]